MVTGGDCIIKYAGRMASVAFYRILIFPTALAWYFYFYIF
jgi:hypothetical protein